jgi:hypothetical protein
MQNQTIKALNEKLNVANENTQAIETELQAAWNEVFKGLTVIRDAVTKLESSQDFIWDKYGEISSYLRFYELSDFVECRSYFETYMYDSHFVNVDWENDCLTYNQGFNIVINEDGDVYDQDGDKFFLNKNDYKNDSGELDVTKRNALIEEYMQKTGCFPTVFSSDRHGNIFVVNTHTNSG